MRLLKAVMLGLYAIFSGAECASGQDYIPVFSQNYTSRLSIEVDPTTFILKGYSFYLRYQPMFSERFLLGAGAYALDLPDFYVDMNAVNRDLGWEVRIRSAYFIGGELYARAANNGWFIGEQIGFQSFKVSIDRERGGSSSFNNLLLMTYVGYSWHPYKGSFYIKPWAGLGITEKVDGINRIGNMTYDISRLFPFFTFHVGYTF